MTTFVNKNPGTFSAAAAYMGSDNSCYVDDCDEASVIVLEQCCECSLAARIADTGLTFGKDGKIKIDEYTGAILKPWHGNGKEEASVVEKTRRKVGWGKAFYFMRKYDEIYEGMLGCSNSVDRSMILNDLTRQLWQLADGYIFSYLTQCATGGCTNCDVGFDNIGTEAAPITLDGTDPEVAAKAFYKYLIDFAAVGDDVDENCDRRKILILNKCYRRLIDYMGLAKTPCCDLKIQTEDLCGLVNSGIQGLDIGWSSKVPAGQAIGLFYNDVALKVNPAVVRYGAMDAQSSAMFDHWYFSLRFAPIRPDRIWTGYLELA